MMYEDLKRSGRRELGRITRVTFDDERGETVWLYWETSGCGQGFGDYHLPGGARKRFMQAICDTFGVADQERLIGRPCYALRAWGGLNDPIIGLESVETGRRFTVIPWLRKEYPDKGFLGYFDQRVESIRRDIAWAKRRLAEAEGSLSALSETGFVDWDTAPAGPELDKGGG